MNIPPAADEPATHPGTAPAPVRVTAWLCYLGGAVLAAVVVHAALRVSDDASVGKLAAGGCVLLFMLLFAVLFVIAGRSLLAWGNVQSLRAMAIVPLLIGGPGVLNGVRRVSPETVPLLVGFAAILAYGLLLLWLPRRPTARGWLAAAQQWATAERQRRVAQFRGPALLNRSHQRSHGEL